jgi:hypothetical protein
LVGNFGSGRATSYRGISFGELAVRVFASSWGLQRVFDPLVGCGAKLRKKVDIKSKAVPCGIIARWANL